MSEKKFSEKEQLLLGTCPERKAQWSIDESTGLAVVETGKTQNSWFEKFIGKNSSNESQLELDEFSSEAWKLCDGRTSFLSISRKLKRKLGDEAEPLFDKLSNLIKQLEENGLLVLRAPLPLDEELTTDEFAL